MSGVRPSQHPPEGAVVQLVRIPACHAGGRGFESRPLRQSIPGVGPQASPFRFLEGLAMSTAANIVVLVVALLHVYILVLEMFLWDKPRGLKAFGITPEFAAQSKVLAANQGL